LFANARDLEYRSTDEVYTYRQCPACESVFLDSPPADRLSVIYPKNYYSYTSDQSPGVAERIKLRLDARLLQQILKQIPGEKLRVLDVGGGTGWMLSLVRRVSPRVSETHEVDIDGDAQPAAEAAGHIFHAMKIEDFEAAGTFDFILMLNLIEHVADPPEVLQAAQRLLSPGGLLLIKTPNIDTFDQRIFRHRNWGGFHCPRHFVLFTMGGFADMADRCGLQVAQAKYTQGGPQWAASVMGVMAERGWATITRDRPMYLHPLMSPLQMCGAAFDFCRLPFAKTAQMLITLKRRT